MGCRLCINIKTENRILGNCYWQSSGYLDEALNILGRLVGGLSLTPGYISSRLYSNNYLEEVIAIYDLFESLGCCTIIPKKLSEEENYLILERGYRFGNVKHSNGSRVKSNIAVPTVGRGLIGLTKEDIDKNNYAATYIIDVYVDKEIIDLSKYFSEIKVVKNNKIAEIKSNILKIKFKDLFKIGKILLENYNNDFYIFKYKNRYYESV